ncbi:MAG: nitrilase family protein [Tannerella sp.]|jgi:predicted amidohydrolase|nr:nitrilase family protein [Tannerella sp.]
MENLRVSLVQTDIVWEDIDRNISHAGDLLSRLKGKTDLAVLPEMFSTGFTLFPENLAEAGDGKTISTVKQYAQEFDFALAGSFIAVENGKFYNRAFFITPSGDEYYCDKRHLFGFSGEDKHFSCGTKRLIVGYKNWNICLMICYDLRFPVWCRNVDNVYDVLVFTANWPHSRKPAWETLLKARAIENLCYAVGVNRTGSDGNKVTYSGGTYIFSPKGEMLLDLGTEEKTDSFELDKKELDRIRTKFPVWKDADLFELKVKI